MIYASYYSRRLRRRFYKKYKSKKSYNRARRALARKGLRLIRTSVSRKRFNVFR